MIVLIYRIIYIKGEKNIYRYYYLVLIFVLSIILIIIRPNIIRIIFGWDGLGLVSYLLVIYYQNYMSYNSGILTVLINRVGDIIILMVVGIIMIYGRWNFFIIKEVKYLIVIVLVAGLTKRAQIPFSSWLPRAIAAPTPVSALVHSSTLVTAGVYLLIRFRKLIELRGVYKILMVLSVLTMFISGLIANFECDIKKIIALSTLRQLGLIIIILRFGFRNLAFYHLLTHAVFKSILFMGAGIIIHLIKNNQDIRLIGGLLEFIPFTIIRFQLSLFSLCGFPFISGFYSKDLIIEIIYIGNFNLIIFILSLISLMFTLIYSVRLIYYLFFIEIKFFRVNIIKEDKVINFSMIILMIMRILIGSMLNWVFFFERIILRIELKILTFIIILIGVLVIVIFRVMNFLKIYYIRFIFRSMWFMSFIWIYIVKFFLELINLLIVIDKVWIEFFRKKIYYNIMIEFKKYYINDKYKIYMFTNWVIIWVFLIILLI